MAKSSSKFSTAETIFWRLTDDTRAVKEHELKQVFSMMKLNQKREIEETAVKGRVEEDENMNERERSEWRKAKRLQKQQQEKEWNDILETQKAKIQLTIDLEGRIFQGANPLPDESIFKDLNYGDMVMVFHNPFYDFLFNERENLEMLKLKLKWEEKRKKEGNRKLDSKELRIKEAEDKREIAQLEEEFEKKRTKEGLRNDPISLLDAYNIYEAYVNILGKNEETNQ
jgi:hypothetical protein